MIAAPAALTPSPVDPDRIRRTTDEVLARSSFDAAEPGPAQRVGTWLLDRLGALVEQLSGTAGGAVVGTVILVLAVGATAFIAARLVRRVRRDRGASPPVAGIGGRSAQDWSELARRAEAARDWAEALRCSYRALLADLVAAGLVDEVAGRTAREYLRDVSEAVPEAAPPLRWVTEAFEATWYDRRPVDASDLDAVRAAARTVRSATPVHR